MEDMEDPDGKLYVQNCGGRDLISNPMLGSLDGKYIFTSGAKKVTIFSTETGQPIRELATGPNVGLAIDKENPSHLLVAREHDLVTWDYELAKVVCTEPQEGKLNTPLLSAVIPGDYQETKEIFAIDYIYRFVKINVAKNTLEVIDKRIDYTLGSLHVGDNDNFVTVIASTVFYKNMKMIGYDRKLDLFQTFETHIKDSFTIVRCHPNKKIFAAGRESGSILIIDAREWTRESLKMCPRNCLVGHDLPVGGLEWSLEGAYLYSGDVVDALYQWSLDRSVPKVIRGLGGQVVGIKVFPNGKAVQLHDNSIKIIDNQDKVLQELVGVSINTNGWLAGLNWNNRTKTLYLNGNEGHVQVFHPVSKVTQNLDIARQNVLPRSIASVAHNSDVEVVALSQDGLYMITVDYCGTAIPRILLKFWHIQHSTQEYVLHTQVDSPHAKGINAVVLKPDNEYNDEMTVLTVGKDATAKLWILKSNVWCCQYLFEFRGLKCQAAAWSPDGSVLAIAFQHIVVIFDKEGRIRTTLTAVNKQTEFRGLTFGQGLRQGFLLACYTNVHIHVWNLINLRQDLHNISEGQEILNLISDPVTGNIAVVTKDSSASSPDKNFIKLMKLEDGSLLDEFKVSCTGGAVYGMYKNTQVLYFLQAEGLIKFIGPKLINEEIKTMTVEKPNNYFLATKRSGYIPKEIKAETRAKPSDDINSLLAVPLHSVPKNSALALSFLNNRVRSLPKQRLSGTLEQTQDLEAGTPAKFTAKADQLRQRFGFFDQTQIDQDVQKFSKSMMDFKK